MRAKKRVVTGMGSRVICRTLRGQMFSELGKEICEAEWNENEPSVGGDEDEIYKLFLDISVGRSTEQ